MKFHIFLTPMHIVEVEADQHTHTCGIHQFVTGDQVIAEFSQTIGWMEVKVEKKDKASVTPLTIVLPNTPPADPAA